LCRHIFLWGRGGREGVALIVSSSCGMAAPLLKERGEGKKGERGERSSACSRMYIAPSIWPPLQGREKKRVGKAARTTNFVHVRLVTSQEKKEEKKGGEKRKSP